MAFHTVEQGECLSSIARRYGLTWKILWDNSHNAELRKKREDPNVLMPGDQVYVREMKQRTTSKGDKATHSFKRKGVPTKLRLRLMRDDKSRANERYVLTVDGTSTTGTLDGNGQLEGVIPCDARSGNVVVGDDVDGYPLDLGALDPVGEATGLQGRLNNLGFYCGEVDGIVGPRTRTAIRQFQVAHASEGLRATGNADDKTKALLKQVYGR